MDLWPAKLKVQWSDIGDGAWKEAIENPEEDATARQIANNAAGRLLLLAFNEAGRDWYQLAFDNWLFELDNVDPSVIRFRGLPELIALLRDTAAGSQEFRVLSPDGTCEMDGIDEDGYGNERYWHCENDAVQTVIAQRPPSMQEHLAVCRKHEEEILGEG